MGITDRQRTYLHRAAEALEHRLDLRFEATADRLTARFERAMRTYFIALLSAFAVLLSVATAVSQRLGG